MTSPESIERARDSKSMLLVCNTAGKVQAITSTPFGEPLPSLSEAECDLAEIVGPDSTINRWVSERIPEARERVEYCAEASLEGKDGRVFVRLESLSRDGEHFGFALQFFPLSGPKSSHLLEEGDSIITRRQWHEIKNHVGALKLYATFLKRKMPDGDERRIVEKIFGGVNALIGYLDRVRRGGP